MNTLAVETYARQVQSNAELKDANVDHLKHKFWYIDTNNVELSTGEQGKPRVKTVSATAT